MTKLTRVLLIGGTSEIGLAILSAMQLPPEADVLLAGRDADRLRSAAASLPGRVTVLPYDATDPAAHEKLVAAAFADGPVDVVISAAGVLIPQDRLDAEPGQAGLLIETNFTSHVTALLAVAAQMRRAGSGVIVILSSVAAVRPRRANFVYGAAKSGLDAFGRGLADSLDGSGVRVLLIRPGFVIGRMTAGMSHAPLSSTPGQVGAAVAAALDKPSGVVWVPSALRLFAVALRLLPRPLWRRLRR
ncbi:MAG TPA: SDR family NAD(P)-dependent oxidoreductase [Streptosporangiaceae bacterium]|nr:SDR family NAD(P)-dependent oxidoreductase [Streptosporangiaceae bacterium]